MRRLGAHQIAHRAFVRTVRARDRQHTGGFLRRLRVGEKPGALDELA